MYAKALMGMGGNLNDPEKTLNEALKVLGQNPGIRIIRVASFYRTKPFGLDETGDVPDFVNTAALLETEHSPEALLEILLMIENQFGRERPLDGHMASRTLDLDLLFYNDEIINRPGLKIPHPRLHARAFVLVPLNEIASSWRHPTQLKSINELYKNLPLEDLQAIVLDKQLANI